MPLGNIQVRVKIWGSWGQVSFKPASAKPKQSWRSSQKNILARNPLLSVASCDTSHLLKTVRTNRSLRTEAGPLAEGMEVDEFMKDRWREDCSWKVSIQEISPLPGHPQLAHCSPQNKVFSPSLCRSRWCVRASIRNNKQYCRINGKPLQNI